MSIPPAPFPWWLWLLVVFWAGAVALWQRGVLPRDWQRGCGLVVWAYSALLIGAATAGTTWNVSRGVFWLAGALTIGSTLLFMRQSTIQGRKLAVWGIACGTAGMHVQLGAELLSGFVLVMGALCVIRLRSPPPQTPTAIAPQDAWLIGVLAAVVALAWMGSLRHAVTFELERSLPGAHVTALAGPEQIRRWIAPDGGDHRSPHVVIEWLALLAALVCLMFVMRRREI